jgi:hypothetical protein
VRIDPGQIDTWVFDLDDTLYPREQGVMGLVQGRINAFMIDAVGLPADGVVTGRGTSGWLGGAATSGLPSGVSSAVAGAGSGSSGIFLKGTTSIVGSGSGRVTTGRAGFEINARAACAPTATSAPM